MNFLPVSARRVGISITLCCVLPLLGSGVRAFADPVYTLEHIGRSDGLPQSSVRAIAVDKSGFLWVGTETGVARYDGYRFKEVAPPFGNGVVMTLHVDSRNRLWVHWYGKPLTLYDPGSEQWQVLLNSLISAPRFEFVTEKRAKRQLTYSTACSNRSRSSVAAADTDVSTRAGVCAYKLGTHTPQTKAMQKANMER